MLTAIIVAAGSSTRFGFDKLFAELAGKPVVQHSVEQFAATKSVEEIIVVMREEGLARLRKLLDGAGFSKVRAIIPGGNRRQDSVRNGLEKVKTEFVAVHDAARALITPTEIERTLEAAQLHSAAALAVPASDTFKRADRDLFVVDSIPREDLFAMQTPQIFRTELLRSAFTIVGEATVTDEVSAVQAAGGQIQLVLARGQNLKITYPADLELAEIILATRLV